MTQTLLDPQDPPAVEVLNAHSDHPLLLVCEHAGDQIPKALNGLGVVPDDREKHICWDIGAGAVTRLIAAALGAPAVIQTYSRLVIDCNRPPDAPDAIPQISDGVHIPGNQNLSEMDRAARIKEIFDPFQTEVSQQITRPTRKVALSIHSFTPWMADKFRPWDIGFLYRHDTMTSQRLANLVASDEPKLCIGMNEPYEIDDLSDWFVPRQGEAHGLPHSLIEIRHDLIREPLGQRNWADILTNAITQYLKEI